MMKLNLASLRRVLKNIDKVTAKQKRDGERFVEKRTQDALDGIKARIPVDEGELRDSAHIEKRDGRPIIVIDAPHAIFVHEDMEASHDDGEAKFAENEMRKQHATFGRDAADAVKV